MSMCESRQRRRAARLEQRRERLDRRAARQLDDERFALDGLHDELQRRRGDFEPPFGAAFTARGR